MKPSNFVAALICLTFVGVALAQQEDSAETETSISDLAEPTDVTTRIGPSKDVTFQLCWLIESSDENRRSYEGPARDGLSELGFGRLVTAGSLASSVTVGRKSVVTGGSRYGDLNAAISMLNTTDKDRIQVQVELQTKSRTPILVETTVRVPFGRWVLLGAVDSRAGQAVSESDGRRSILIMRVIDGVQLLD